MLKTHSTLCTVALALQLTACGSGGDSETAPVNTNANTNASNSTANSSASQNTASHNAGQDCMNSGCHDGTGSAEKFTAAGTIYTSNGAAQTNATVRLYVHNTNTLSLTAETDSSGNFYTTQAVDGLSTGNGLVSGVDVEVEGPGGIRTMPGLVTNGSCNACHGVSNSNIVAN